MPHTHEFDCRICGVHLDSREDLNRHAAASHPKQMAAATGDDRYGAGTPRSDRNEGDDTRR